MSYKKGDKVRINDHEFQVVSHQDGEVVFQMGTRLFSLPEELVVPEPRVGDVWLDRFGHAYLVASDAYDDLVGLFVDEKEGGWNSVTLVDRRDLVERIYTREDS